MSLSQPYRARRVAVVSATTVGVLVALSGAPSPATAQGRPEAPGRSTVVGPQVPTGSFIGPVLGMSPLHSARSTEPLARKFK